MELTIVMPCLNEAETIEVCVRKAVKFIADSGIERRGAGRRQRLDRRLAGSWPRRAGARVVAVPERGYGAALMGGIARGARRVRDHGRRRRQLRLREPRRRSSSSCAPAHDLVMGNRFKGGIAPGAMPLPAPLPGQPGAVVHRPAVLPHPGRRLPLRPARLLARGDRSALGLQSPGMEFASEMVVKATLQGLRIEEVPTTLAPDGRSRPPHLKTWRDGWRHLRFLLLHSPRWLFIYPGMVLLVLGIGLGVGGRGRRCRRPPGAGKSDRTARSARGWTGPAPRRRR